MSAYRNYPEGYEPTAGPFLIKCGFQKRGAHRLCVSADGESVNIGNPKDAMSFRWLKPMAARELAAALIECADNIDRESMTTEDIARETRNRT